VRSPELPLSWADAAAASYNASSRFDASLRSIARRANAIGRAPSENNTVGLEVPTAERFAALLAPTEPSEQAIQRLQAALRNTCEELQSLAEEYQTALEELRSANEELHSVNEEMQSTNEELETSKEEIQSVNEELHTVNIRLTEKVQELDQSNSDLRNLFDSTEIATVFLDRHLIIRSYTPAIAPLYNLIPSDVGRPLTDIVTRLEYSDLRQDVATVLSTLEPLERRVARKDETAYFLMRILPYRAPDNMVSGTLLTFIDITSIVQAESALLEADVRKDTFLATLSHELRNPLAPIRTAAHLLMSPAIAPDALQSIGAVITRQTRHMGALLDDLLDLSRITRGVFKLNREYVGLRTVVDDAVEAVQSEIQEKGHRLDLALPKESITLDVDAVRMTQVLTNVLSNAVKYTPPSGRIQIRAQVESHDLAIHVIDNGVGIEADSLHKIFNMFERGNGVAQPRDSGLGIGLALAKGMVELHGGRIEARSLGLGRGSEFTISLPRSVVVRAEDKDTEKRNQIPHQSKCIVLADDNRDLIGTMEIVLKMVGHDVHVAFSGAEAFELVCEKRPDVAVIDIGMPDMGGYEVAERVRSSAWGKTLTLIAMTGWGQEEDRRRAKAAGFDHHLTKPVDPSALIDLIDKFFPLRNT
jgi:two-component system CheB/CheR fusion protein